ncbi:site-specific DNA-methyltransferase [Vibrio sp. 10N.261.55.B8]|uniref:site-specific DNA-methyltransferase n=1 Tax=Vibrio sp. 10N.261.55.B8 TaxID=3229688 RepID=UPI00354CE233
MTKEVEKITGNSPEAKSLDITQQNIEQLKQLFPDVFSENKIDFEALKAVLGEEIDDSEERYNFTWNGKTKARKIAQTPSTGTLRPCKEESVNWDTTENLFIEGDNLEVLKLLQKSYHKKVKMIYIDPPYNTGKDFVYKDNFKDNIQNYLEQSGQVDSEGNRFSTNSESSGRYHSDWLNMIYPRLKLARNLLKNEGVIFISIDECEVNNLINTCNEIFGETNFIGKVSWYKSYGKNESKFFSNNVEYIVCYAKSIACLESEQFVIEKEGFEEVSELLETAKVSGLSTEDAETNLRKFYKSRPELKGISAYNKVDDNYKAWQAVSLEKPKDPCYFYEIFHPITNQPCKIPKKGWRMPKETAERYMEDGILVFYNDHSSSPRRKYFLENVKFETPKNFISNSDQGGNDIGKLFENNQVFDFPKPLSLMKYLLSLINDNKALILDFFAGSGTTAHAAYALNKEDQGSRKTISVQLPELVSNKSVAHKEGYKVLSELTRERLSRAIDSLGVKDGFKVFKLDKTNIRPWDADFDNLEQVLQQATESIKADRSSEDVLYEIFLKYGYDLTTPVETEVVNGKAVFVVGAGALIVCLDDEITGETVEGIAKLKEELDPETTQVVFKDAGFADSNVKTNAIQILKQAGIDDVKSI